MYDGVFPEYVISYNEIYLRDEWNAVKEFFKLSTYVTAAAIGISLFYILF